MPVLLLFGGAAALAYFIFAASGPAQAGVSTLPSALPERGEKEPQQGDATVLPDWRIVDTSRRRLIAWAGVLYPILYGQSAPRADEGRIEYDLDGKKLEIWEQDGSWFWYDPR